MLTSILISLIFFLACGVQGITGFGTSLVAMPLLVFLIDIKTAVPLCILQSVVITFYLTFQLRDHMDLKKIAPLVAGCLPAIYLGVTFLKHMETAVLTLLLGLLILFYTSYMLIFNPGPRKMHRAWPYITGFCTGFFGSALSIGGPPVIIYTTLTGWTKDQIKATMTGLFVITASITTAAHAATGIIDALVIKYFLISAPFAFIGVYSGSLLYSRIKRDLFIRIILILLVMVGLFMSVSALKRLGG